MRKERKYYTAEEKVAILRRHLLEHVPVSDLCEELGLQPTVFYRWQKEFFENGAAAFQTPERPLHQVEEKQKRIEFLEKKVQTKDEVLAFEDGFHDQLPTAIQDGDHNRFLVHVHADILDVATHFSCLLGESHSCQRLSFPQGKVPFSSRFAYALLHFFPTAHTTAVTL